MIRNFKFKGIIVLLMLFILASVVIINVTSAKKSEGVEYVIGMSQANLYEPWRISMNEEIMEEAKKYKNVKIIYKDAAGDTNKQKNDINELVDDGVDLLIVSINDSEQLTPVVSKVYKSIPVILLDRAVEGYDYTLYIGTDNESIGRQAGNMVKNLVGRKQGKVIEVQGLLDSPPVISRSEGFRDALKGSKNIEIDRTVIGEWQRDETEDKITDALKEDKDIDVIFAHNDYMALGAYKAAYNLGIKNIKIIGVDGLPDENGGLDLVSKGILQGTFTCPTGGKEAIDYAMNILNKKEATPKRIILRSDKVTIDNVSKYLNKKVTVSGEHKKIKLGYAQLKSESSWRDENEESIKEAAKDAGVDLVFLESGTNQEDQKRLIRQLIKMKVDIISFSPFVESGWDDVLKEAKNAGIPVVITDRTVDSDDTNWVSSIGSDFLEEGKRVARVLIGHFNKDKTNILEIKGNTGSTPSIERDQGFKEITKNYSNYKIIKSDVGNFTYEGGKEVTEKFLRANKNKINVVYAQNDDMALGAIEAIKEYGLIPGKDIIVLGIDGTQQALNFIKMGQMYCTIGCNPILGPQLIKTVEEVMAGNEVPLKIISSEDIFVKDNSGKF